MYKTTHNVHYPLSVNEQTEIKRLISPIHFHDHVFTWLTSSFYLFLLYLLYRASLIFLVGGEYLLQNDQFLSFYNPFLYIDSVSLNNITIVVLLAIQIALAVFFVYRFFFFYYFRFISGKSAFARKDTKKDYVINSSVDDDNLSFTYTVKDKRKKAISILFTEQDIIKAVPYKSGYLFVCSLYPFFLSNLKRKKLDKTKVLQNLLAKHSYFLMVYFAKVKGILVYFPIPDSFTSVEKEQLNSQLSQKLKNNQN